MLKKATAGSKFNKQKLSLEKGRACPRSGGLHTTEGVGTCPEPGPLGWLLWLQRTRKKSTPFSKEDSMWLWNMDPVSDKTYLTTLSVSKHVQRKDKPWVFLSATPTSGRHRQEQYTCPRFAGGWRVIQLKPTLKTEASKLREQKNDNMF